MTEACQHKTKQSRYLTSHLTPHMMEPDTKSVMTCVFLCEGCGDLFTSNIEVLRGYQPDGSIPPKLLEISEVKRKNLEMNMLVEARARQLLDKRLAETADKSGRAGATAAPIATQP